MALLAVPLIVAVALVLTPVLVKTLDRNAGWPLAATFAGLAGYIISHARTIIEGGTVTWSVTWIKGLITTPSGQVEDINFILRMDALSMFFTLLALCIGAVVFIYSTRYLHKRIQIMSFYLLMTSFMLAVVILLLADDVFLLFIGWELVSLASFSLIARSGSSGEAGSTRTLLLTFTGGLFLLAAVGFMVATTGTTQLSAIIDSPAWREDKIRTSILAVLVALAGFSKAAQIPFHFWLPEAMAADTPVSAFLHAAAVVKAGIYLLMRFSGLFEAIAMWHVVLIIVGMATAVMAAVFALQKTNLKKLTAYSTVSQLGWIVATIGVGTPAALSAALVHTASHALFKSSLFMLAGIVDHQSGTREMTRLGSLWRQMPWTFSSAVIAAASMAAIPPTLGFVSKEGLLAALEEAPFPLWGVVVLMSVATFGAVATFLYSARYITGAFIDGPRDMSHVKEAPAALWIPAALPGVLSLPIVVFLGVLGSPFDAAVAATGVGRTETHLALWHGLTLPLGISIIVFALGAIGVYYRKRISAVLVKRRLMPFTGVELLSMLIQRAIGFGRKVGVLAQSQSPNRHVLMIFGLIIGLAAAGFMTPNSLNGLATIPPRVSGIDKPTDLIGFVLVALPVLGIISTRSRLASIVLLGIAGMGVSWLMLTLGAPDVALTNLLVEFCVVVILMMVLRHQPRLYLREGENRTKLATALGTIAGLISFFGVYLLVGRHDKPIVAQWYLDNTPDITGANNVVAAILVEFRAFDTMGELIVLGAAGIVLASIIKSIPRSPLPGYGPGSTSELFRAEGSTRFPDVHKVPELAPFYSKYLRSTHLNSILSRQALLPIIPLLVAVSLNTFWRGHQAPGGGFLAALVAAGGLFLWYVGQPHARTIGSDGLGYRLIGLGILTALLTGLMGLIVRGHFLEPIYGEFLGQHLTTSLIFDGGVYLAVLGLIVVVINQLGGRERPGAEPRPFQGVSINILGDSEHAQNTLQRSRFVEKAMEAVEEQEQSPSTALSVMAPADQPTDSPQKRAQEKRQRLAEKHRKEREAARLGGAHPPANASTGSINTPQQASTGDAQSLVPAQQSPAQTAAPYSQLKEPNPPAQPEAQQERRETQASAELKQQPEAQQEAASEAQRTETQAQPEPTAPADPQEETP